jgi:hypothetical protein
MPQQEDFFMARKTAARTLAEIMAAIRADKEVAAALKTAALYLKQRYLPRDSGTNAAISCEDKPVSVESIKNAIAIIELAADDALERAMELSTVEVP